MVQIVGAPGAPIASRSTVSAPKSVLCRDLPVDVLLFLENGDPALPIIVGFIKDRLTAEAEADGTREESWARMWEGKRLTIEAAEEITLKCGKSVFSLRADGRVTTRGTELSSRATGQNKIKGASVSIN
jgi:hypothetical protein